MWLRSGKSFINGLSLMSPINQTGAKGNNSWSGGGRPLVIAGAASGVGKTIVAAGFMGACRRQGLKVAPFKIGPDYIDPGFHFYAAGAPSRNLDTWLTSRQEVKNIYRRGAAGAEISVVEGVMGLFDGRSGAGSEGSTAEVSCLIGAAVVLVVDCARQARSLAPLLAGFAAFDDSVPLAGCILNNVGSLAHARELESAAAEAGVTVLGALPRRPETGLPSRHLGLVPAGERDHFHEKLELVIDNVQENIDMDGLLSLAVMAPERPPGFESESKFARERPGGGGRIRLAVANDEAFSFYYVDSLEALAAAGAEIVRFSPLNDRELPVCDGLYLGGGFPEMFAARLEANKSMRESVAATVAAGLPTYAECGGLVYLCRHLEVAGKTHRMAAALPLEARMTGRRQALGYVEATARRGNILMPAGATVRGHEFHWSAIDWDFSNAAYDCTSGSRDESRLDGFSTGSILASYVHLHFGGNRAAAEAFVDAAGLAGEVKAGAGS